MDLIKLLDVANPKKIKDTLNILIENYENFGDRVQSIAAKAAEDSAAALAAGNEAKQIAQENTESLEQSIAAQDGVVAQAAEDSANAKQTAEEALAMIEQADARSQEATTLAEQAIATADEATATSELAMNVATEAKSTVDQAISTGVFGTFVHNSAGISLLHAHMTDDINAEDTEERFHVATPKLVRDALSESAAVLNAALEDKVDKIVGKGLSTNDYTTVEKQKLAGVEEGANNYVLPNEVVQDASYVHTDNNYTTSEKTKLAGLTNYDDTLLSNRVTAVEEKNTEQDASINQKLPLSGGTMTGNIDMNGNDLTNIKYLYDVHGNRAFGVGGNFYVIGNEETILGFLGLNDALSYNGRGLAFASDIENVETNYKAADAAIIESYEAADASTNEFLNEVNTELTSRINRNAQNITNNFNNLSGRDYIVAQGANYVRWNGGLQICWGFDGASLGDYQKIITLPMAYANTNYIVLGTPQTQGTDTWSFYASVESTTTFKWRNRSGALEMYWFAIGRWK